MTCLRFLVIVWKTIKVANTFFASVFLGSGIWVFNMWGSLGSLWGALKHKEHKYWGVEINDLPEQLHSTASSTDGLAAIDSEGKNYYTTFEDFHFEVICCLKLCEKSMNDYWVLLQLYATLFTFLHCFGGCFVLEFLSSFWG